MEQDTEFVEKVSSVAGKELNVRGTKQRMNRWKYALEDLGVYFDQTDSTSGILEGGYAYEAKNRKHPTPNRPVHECAGGGII